MDNDYSIETLTCLALARLYNDPSPDNNNFDCGWDWRLEHERSTDRPKEAIQASGGSSQRDNGVLDQPQDPPNGQRIEKSAFPRGETRVEGRQD